MKTKIFFAFFFLTIPIKTYSQKLTIYKSVLYGFKEQKTTGLKSGNYLLKITGKYNPKNESLNFIIENKLKPIDDLDDPSSLDEEEGNRSTDINFEKDIKFKINNRSEIKIIAQILDNNKKILHQNTITYSGLKKTKWVTSFGIAASFLQEIDTYRTVKKIDSENNTLYTIEEDGRKNQIQEIPIIQFTYINLEKEIELIPTAGIGLDINNISVFAGLTCHFGQNIFLTFGGIFHKQRGLNTIYKIEDTFDSELSIEQLHSEYYKINPFISLTYKFKKNIFKK